MSGMTPEEADVFARGLHWLATQDGIDPREEELIRGFLDESDATISWDELAAEGFSPLEAASTLEASYMRRIFIKAAVALVRADGQFSDKERHALGEIADAFGISNAEFGDIEQAATSVDLGAI